ncbi:heme/hemin ABC transporter substrate-binding protein [Sphingobacterium psychroaquaticum]|uniref:Iron complex transport system substrate-binding protein n=1 Tax=Sphingobacterium psychroaquaticum TaxID=561061 RepID=A0A1X7HXA0_9SPHI|nr:ABC transporter substrate-binding protein [Sphingobacterium psychroaquaticum]SMG06069.1 iron complex transport system substrate-binding protein [Sphingobacterium psychroaquaticum]
MKLYIVLTYLFIALFSAQIAAAQQRIITLSSAISETVHALGREQSIVAVDVTSEYPAVIKSKPRASRDRTFSLEGLLAFKPDLILTPSNQISYPTEVKLKQLGIRVVTIDQEYSVKGAEKFIKTIAQTIHANKEGTALVTQFQTNLKMVMAALKQNKSKKKVLFIYARGVGLMSVAGKGSPIDALIDLAGGRNAVQEFSDFRTYTTEALIKSNPDVLLLFDFGATSLGGKEAVLNMPGVSLTNAGKMRQIITMEGPLLVNFATRLPQAIRELNRLLYAVK